MEVIGYLIRLSWFKSGRGHHSGNRVYSKVSLVAIL